MEANNVKTIMLTVPPPNSLASKHHLGERPKLLPQLTQSFTVLLAKYARVFHADHVHIQVIVEEDKGGPPEKCTLVAWECPLGDPVWWCHERVGGQEIKEECNR